MFCGHSCLVSVVEMFLQLLKHFCIVIDQRKFLLIGDYANNMVDFFIQVGHSVVFGGDNEAFFVLNNVIF